MKLMTVDDVLSVIRDIEIEFNKNYSPIQTRLITGYLAKLTYQESRKLLNFIADDSKYLPRPKDIRDISYAVMRDRAKNREPDPEFNPKDDSHIMCFKCYDTGLCFLRLDGCNVLASCICPEAQLDAFEQAKPESPFVKFPIEKLKPKNVYEFARNIGGSETVIWWKQQKEISQAYWAHKKTQGENNEGA